MTPAPPRTTPRPADPVAAHAGLLDGEVRDSLRRACLVAAPLGLVIGGLMVAADRAGLVAHWLIPGVWAVACGAVALAFHRAAKLGAIRGRRRALFVVVIVSLPAILYALAYAALPSGTATYITGPASYLYLFTVLLTGFLFSPRLSLLAGLLAGTQYAFFFHLARPGLASLSSPDPVLLQDLTQPAMYLIKAVIMALGGALVALLAAQSRRLMGEMLREERERERLDRLFGEYVSEDAKARILEERLGGAGERRDVAVLFCDLRGFTAMSEAREPEAVVAELNDYLARMVDALARHGGTVDKFIGDAVMAVFGGLVPLENPCAAAVRAAGEMRRELARLNVDRAGRGLPPLANGVGVHFGPVLLGPIGSPSRKDFTVIGDAVNLASRVEALTKEFPEAILASAAVVDRLPADLRARAVARGAASVKGQSRPIDLYGFPDA